MNRINPIAAKLLSLAAVLVLAACWDEAEVNGRWTTDPSEIPSMDIVEVSSGDRRRISVSNSEGHFGFTLSCPGHYAFVAGSTPPITVFLWTQRTFTGCRANGEAALKSLPESAR